MGQNYIAQMYNEAEPEVFFVGNNHYDDGDFDSTWVYSYGHA